MKRFLSGALTGSMLCGWAVAAQPPRAIFTEIPSSPTSLVPGMGGARFDIFERPYGSPDGRHWIISAGTDGPVAEDEVVIVRRFGTPPTVVAREGTEVPNGLPGELWGIFDQSMGINNNGDIAVGNNTSAVTSADEIIAVQRANGSWEIVNREGQAVPSIVGATWGATTNSVEINDDGSVNFRASSILVIPTANDSAAFINNGQNIVAQEGITIPAPGPDAWQLFDPDDFRTAANGEITLIQGDTFAGTTIDDVLVYNGTIVIQEGMILPGSDFVVTVAANGIVEPYLAPNGDWFARGGNVDGDDWLVRNGEVVVKTGDPVPGGLPGEVFDDAQFAAMFFLTVASADGSYVFGSLTSNPDVERDAVLVYVPGGDYSQAYVFLRQRDGVDLDGNGQLDDNVYIDVFNNDDAILTDDGRFYFTADLYDAAKLALGQGFLMLDLTPLAGDMNCDGVLSVSDIGGFVAALTDPAAYAAANPECSILNGDLNNDGQISVSDIGPFVDALTGG
jgi:hypothetical protein